MMRHLRFAIVLFVLLIALSDPANAFIELNGFYYSDTLGLGSSFVTSRMNAEVGVGFMVDKKGKFLVGWGYNMMTSSDTAPVGTTTTYSSTQMGPRFVVGLDKDNAWTVGLGYYLVTTATYDDSTGAVTWKGTALKFDFGYNFPITSEWMLGIRMNYSSASYAEQLVGSSTYSVVSNTRVQMYPTIYTIYYF